MNVVIDTQGRVVNPAVQIHTSMYAIMRDGNDIGEDGEPKFGREANSDVDYDSPSLNFFRELDPLTYKSYDPAAVYAARELDRSNDLSSMAASNINSIKPQ